MYQTLSRLVRYAFVFVLVGAALHCCGCSGLRLAATEAQKHNAFLHEQVCTAAAETAVDEAASAQLCALTDLAAEQSAAFVIDYGLPAALPPADDVDALLAAAPAVAETAQTDAARRPDVWTLTDSALELGIALAGLIGGVYGVRIAGFFKTARDKSKALKEIIDNNDLFKQLYPDQVGRFKHAQQKQSPATKQLVTAVRSE